MKQAILILVLLCFGCKADSHVSRKEVKAAKYKFFDAKYGVTVQPQGSHRPYSQDIISIDSLYWRGLKAIRHDQKFWIGKK